MAYTLKSIKIRTNNSPEGMVKINDMWKDIVSGKIDYCAKKPYAC